MTRTRPENPVFKLHGVTHYCVPNTTANAPRSASRALSLGALPFLQRLAETDLETALRNEAGLARGVYMYRGKVVNRLAANALGVEHTPIPELLG